MRDSVLPDGAQIRDLRKARGWTQDHLSTIVGFHKRTIEKAEKGGRIMRSYLEAIAKALRVPSQELELIKSANGGNSNAAARLAQVRSRGGIWTKAAGLVENTFYEQVDSLEKGCLIVPRGRFSSFVRYAYSRTNRIWCTSVPDFEGFWDADYGSRLLQYSRDLYNNYNELTVRIFLVNNLDIFIGNLGTDGNPTEIRERIRMFQRQKANGVRPLLVAKDSDEFLEIEDEFRNTVTEQLFKLDPYRRFHEQIEVDLAIFDNLCDSLLDIPKQVGSRVGGEEDLHGIFFFKDSQGIGQRIYKIYVELFETLKKGAIEWDVIIKGLKARGYT